VATENPTEANDNSAVRSNSQHSNIGSSPINMVVGRGSQPWKQMVLSGHLMTVCPPRSSPNSGK
jgi:hypothetical protein